MSFPFFNSVCHVCQNRQKADCSLVYLIAWAEALCSLQTLLLRGLIPSFIITMLTLYSVIDFHGTVVSYTTALLLITIGVLTTSARINLEN